MSAEMCTCGHSRDAHAEIIYGRDEKRAKGYRKWVAKGLGLCLICDCKEFKKLANEDPVK
jgi:hypothetical protein